jgi:RNA polymerase sigma-70 factor (ECF subfamily)
MFVRIVSPSIRVEVVSGTTSESLLLRLRLVPADEDAWARFVDGYSPLIRAWCRERGLGEGDVQDVCQDVLTKLVTTLRTFSYDPSLRFRGWLRTVVQHALSDYHRQRRQEPARGSGDTQVLELLGNQEARDDLMARLDRAFDLEIFEQAKTSVQSRVAAHNWQAFVRTDLEGCSISQTARELGIDISMVYVARTKIRKMLRREIERLESPFEESSTDDARRLSRSERVAPVPQRVS